MNIRKTIIIGVMAAGMALAGLQQVSARGWGDGPGGGDGDCFCQGAGFGYQQMDDASKAKVDAFRTETMDLRKQIAMKQAEKRALMSNDSPDAAAVAKVAGELFDLKNMVADKAKAAGVPMMMGQDGMGRHGGKGGGGRMAPPCMDQRGWN